MSTEIQYDDLQHNAAQIDAAVTAVQSLAPVASSGAYDDLTGPPVIDTALSPTSTNAVQNNAVSAALSGKADSADLTALSALEAADRAALAAVIDSGTKNLVNTLDAQNYNYQGTFPAVIAGVTYTRNADGSISATGSTSATRVFKVPVSLENGKVYTISGCPSGGSDSGYRVDIRKAGTVDVVAIDYGEGASFTASQAAYDLCIRYPSGAAPAETFKLMVCVKAAWDISQNYVPYVPDNAALWAMIQALEANV